MGAGLAHYCAILNHATVTGSHKFGIFVYDAESLPMGGPCLVLNDIF